MVNLMTAVVVGQSVRCDFPPEIACRRGCCVVNKTYSYHLWTVNLEERYVS